MQGLGGLVKALAENKTGKDFERKLIEMWNLRDRAQRYARDVAPYFHPQLQAIKHDHQQMALHCGRSW